MSCLTLEAVPEAVIRIGNSGTDPTVVMEAVVLPKIEDDPAVVLCKAGGVEEDAVLTEADSEATSRRPTPSRSMGPVSPIRQ